VVTKRLWKFFFDKKKVHQCHRNNIIFQVFVAVFEHCLPPFVCVQHVVVECFDISEEHTASTFRVIEKCSGGW
jgi:hypothetical protein